MSGLLGGFSHDQTPTTEVINLVNSNSDKILKEAGANSDEVISVISYSTQVVAGINYRINVKIAGKSYKVVIYQDLSQNTSVTSVNEA